MRPLPAPGSPLQRNRMCSSPPSSLHTRVVSSCGRRMEVIQMVRSKSSGHLSESQSSLLGAPAGLLGAPPGERLLLGASSSSSSGERRCLGERYHPGERQLGGSSRERILLGERFQAGT